MVRSEVATARISRKKPEGFSCGCSHVTKAPALKASLSVALVNCPAVPLLSPISEEPGVIKPRFAIRKKLNKVTTHGSSWACQNGGHRANCHLERQGNTKPPEVCLLGAEVAGHQPGGTPKWQFRQIVGG